MPNTMVTQLWQAPGLLTEQVINCFDRGETVHCNGLVLRWCMGLEQLLIEQWKPYPKQPTNYPYNEYKEPTVMSQYKLYQGAVYNRLTGEILIKPTSFTCLDNEREFFIHTFMQQIVQKFEDLEIVVVSYE